jgi:hypothetical protein
MPDYREVTIQLDYEDGLAHVWCAPHTVERKLARLGWKRVGEQAKGTWWQGPLKGISFRKLDSMRVGTRRAGNPGALAKANAARRKPPVSATD